MSDLGDLYPFLESTPRAGGDPGPVLAAVRESTLRKARDIAELRREMWERSAAELERAAHLCARAWKAGGKLIAFGNGGSATDARDLVDDLTDPPRTGWEPLRAIDLTRDVGVITAVGNDVGFEHVFLRPLIALGNPGDVAVGFSTSGESANVLEAFRVARERGLATIGFAGYEGGRMAELAADGRLDALVVAPSSHIPRIQEAHATAYHAMIAMARALLGER